MFLEQFRPSTVRIHSDASILAAEYSGGGSRPPPQLHQERNVKLDEHSNSDNMTQIQVRPLFTVVDFECS